MSDYPVQFVNIPRCGAKTRGARGGRPCRSPAMANGKCRLHGGKSPGAPLGEQHPNFKTGRYTKQTRELGAMFRKLAKDGEVLLAETLDAHGLGRKLPKALRRRGHIRRARAAAKARKQGETK
jgi:hypothetical protein